MRRTMHPRRRTSLAAASLAVGLSFAGLLGGCGPEDTLQAYEVTITTTEDCSQVGAGPVQCADPEVLRQVSTTGRWIFDYRGVDTFALTTDTGRVLPGVYFSNNGGLISESCTGQGGRCHFARSRTDSVDPNTGCLRIEERVIDVFDLDGALSGLMSDVIVSDESCGTSNVRQILIEVTGHPVDEPVHAREVFEP